MIPEKLTKPYNPQETEGRIYKRWEESGFFNPDKLPGKRKTPFSMVLPPPNATGTLHIGGSLMAVIEDIIVRYKRMRGFKTLWLPGTDHAAIATNAKVEKILYKEEGGSRHDIGRDAFIARVEAFVADNRGAIKRQIAAIGASLDWSREAFTLDEQRNLAVRTAFKKMHDDGLIYRGYRVINWDPKGQTTISDDEIVYKEEKTKLYSFRYSKDFPIPIATTRPETKLGDVAIAVHPDDVRYQKYIGKIFEITDFVGTPLIIKIVGDAAVDKEFGTGAVGITPAHSAIDWDIAERHELDKTRIIINEYAKMQNAGALVGGKKVVEARALVVAWLKENGLLEKEEEAVHNIATAERTGGIIEPLPKLQWFVNVSKPIPARRNKTLKELMYDAVVSGKIKILPERFEKVYFHWINNLHDWNISRQIWYGHRIPAWYHEPRCVPKQGHENEVKKCKEIIVAVEKPVCEFCDAAFIQDPDTLDTWFSSGMWTFSALGWPQQTEDLKTYHPTDVLETGYDILFFWVAKMILMSECLLGEVPFKVVYLHGLVRNERGEKLSKSQGDNIDPISIISQYGADALRMALIVGVAPGADSKLLNEKLKAYKHFANKLWNIARFVLSPACREGGRECTGVVDADIKKECEALAKDITSDMEAYRFHLAAEKIYHFVWHRFADVIIEESKKRDGCGATLYYVLENSLKLLHPFMPFITEEIWGLMPERKNLLMVEQWPQ